MSKDPGVERLSAKLNTLKHQYDHYLSGQRRTEPLALLREVEREVLELTKAAATQSTVVKFQVRSLAQRFRALQMQIKNIFDLRSTRLGTLKGEESGASVIIDPLALENPALIAARARTMCRELGGDEAEKAPGLTPEQLSKILLGKARPLMKGGTAAAVRFSVCRTPEGPKIKGEVISQVPAAANEK